MKLIPLAAACLLSAATFGLPANAQIFSSSMSATKDSDVFVGAGGTALAWDFSDSNNSSTTTVNGVVFSGNKNNAATGVDFSYAVTQLGGYDQNGVDDTALAASGGSENYANVLQHLVYGFQSFSLTFTGLKAGNTYELQTFGGGGASAAETLTDPSIIAAPASPTGTLYYGAAFNPAVAAFINETFIAPVGGTETINITGDSYLVFSAVNLQDTTAVPEPSTIAMMLGSVAFLGLLIRRRRA
jgi:hypothetical protein